MNRSKIIFIHGLPKSGKTTRLYKIMRNDKYKDICFNLSNYKLIDGLKYTRPWIHARNQIKYGALMVPKHNSYAQYKFIKLYKLEHPRIKHAIIDEVERYPINELSKLLKTLRYFYPRTPIIMAGVDMDSFNRNFKTSIYLLRNFKSKNVNPHCRYCKRKSCIILNIYHKKKVSWKWVVSHNKKDEDFIKTHMHRYLVCNHHYLNWKSVIKD